MIRLLHISRPIQDILLSGLAVTASAILLTAVVSAWTVPAATPPSGNVGAPINTGATYQIKSGSLGANGVAVFGNSILQANSYLNFGTTSGTSSYGIRDVSGGLQFKNQNGQWSSLASTTASFVSSSQWQAGSSGAIYYTAGNVGINTAVPVAPLDINGTVRLSGQTAAPVTCNAARKGSIAVTNATAVLCVCNGSSWVTESNGGTCAWNVVPGSQDFWSPGTHTFTVPAYNTLTVYVVGGGGGGGSGYYSGSVAGTAGGPSSFNGTVVANGGGGGGGGGVLAGSYGGAGGTASGGSTNSTGGTGSSACNATTGGSSPNGGAGGWTGPTYSTGAVGDWPGGGGGAGCNNLGYGGGGGGGGYSTRTYSAGQLSGNITVVVGGGGVGGQWSYYGGDGAGGRVYIEWN